MVRLLPLLVSTLLAVSPAAAQPPQGGAARAARLIARGDAFLASGDRGSAIGYFREAIQANPLAAEAYRRLGEAYRDRGSLGDARTILEAGLTRVPEDAALWMALARTLVALGEPEDAARAVRSLLARDPGNAEALRLRASLARERGAWSEALTAHRALIASGVLEPDELAEARRYEQALRLLARPLDPLSAPRACEGSPVRRALARCR
ncbi:MAG: tetratricopeptide repeat protein [Sandaracinaceae bacterium]|nr:tetratricopeptide repeat protein [Sandaracinaceae bacterium]